MKFYFIPGLGYDCRIFEKWDLLKDDGQCLNWIEPEIDESFNQYAERLFQPVVEEEIGLIGHSLGGMIAQQICSKKKVRLLILISSIQSRTELPLFFKMVKPMKLYKIFTKELCLKTFKFWANQHGFTNPEEKELFKSMVERQSNAYLQWALRSLSAWQSPKISSGTRILQIHGTKDKTFPIGKLSSPDIMIEGGDHFMVYSQAEVLNKIVSDAIG